MKKLLLSTALLAVMTGAHAYQVELNGGLSYANVETPAGDIDANNVGIGATYYFAPVNDTTSPLAEAAFINRASNVSVGYIYTDVNDLDIKDHDFTVAGEFYVPNSNVYLSAGLNRTKVESSSANDYGYAAEVGFLPSENFLLAVGLAGVENSADDDVDPTFRAKYVGNIGTNTVNLEAAARFGDDVEDYNFVADYYIDNTFSIGADYNLSTIDGGKDPYTFGLNARKFVTTNISVQGALTFGKDIARNDITGIAVGATYRF